MSELLARLTHPLEGVSHEASAPPLELRGVSVAYAAGQNGQTKRATAGAELAYALENISFCLRPKERIALVGPNGAGKSTLMKVIVGLIKPTSGSVLVFGKTPEKHTCIAYVPQRNQVDWSFPVTVEEVVMMGRVGHIGLLRRPKTHDYEQVQHALEQVRAAGLAKKQIGELSGGQQQRVFIARALAQAAELLLLDEPFNGLDTPSRETLFEILDDVQKSGVTSLVATHDLDVAAERFNRIMLINKQMVAFDEPHLCLTAHHLIQAYGGLKPAAG
jgi:manganese/iron transport system ATP-binding protein